MLFSACSRCSSIYPDLPRATRWNRHCLSSCLNSEKQCMNSELYNFSFIPHKENYFSNISGYRMSGYHMCPLLSFALNDVNSSLSKLFQYFLFNPNNILRVLISFFITTLLIIINPSEGQIVQLVNNSQA